MKSRPLFSRLTSILAWCLALIPPCLMLALIARYGVDVPHWDDWEYVKFFQKFSEGTLSFGDLFVQQNEYRQFFPNLIFVGLGWLTKWDLRFELLVSFALACLVSFNIYRLEKLTIGGSPARRMVIFFFSNLLIFSPVQYENWLLGVQIVYFMPVACLTTCMVVAYSQLAARAKFFWCMCLATVSTFSSANGMLCWLVVLPLLIWPPPEGKQQHKTWLILAWIAGFVANVALYFYGYQFTVTRPSPLEALVHPARALRHFLVLLAQATDPAGLIFLARSPVGHFTVALITGLSLATLLIVFALWIRGDPRPGRRAMAWLMLGTYSIATAALVTFGRSGFGVEQAFSPRYTTFTLYLPVALVHLVPLILESRMSEGWLSRHKEKLLKALAVGVFALHLVIYPFNIRHMGAFNRKLLQSKACLLLINVVEDECLAEKVFPDVGDLKPAANSLDALGFLRPRLIRSNRVEDLEAPGAHNPDDYGSIDSITQNGEIYTASGWAVLPERDDSADAILLTYKSPDGDSIIFARADTGPLRGAMAGILRRGSPAAYARWQKSFAVNDLPGDPIMINAWAFDARIGKAAQLHGSHVIEK